MHSRIRGTRIYCLGKQDNKAQGAELCFIASRYLVSRIWPCMVTSPVYPVDVHIKLVPMTSPCEIGGGQG